MIPVDSAAYTLEDQQRMSKAKNYFAWQYRLIHKELGSRVLEVGCGVGNFTGTLLDREAVIAVDVEHVEDDVAALKAVASVLTPGGVIFLLVPAFQALYGPIDKNLGHHRRYSRGAIRSLARRTGLRIRKLHYMNSIGFFGWWANSHILKREAQSEGQIEVFDRYLVPLISAVEGLARPPFGQSLLAVFEKP